MCSTFLGDPVFDFIQDKYKVLYFNDTIFISQSAWNRNKTYSYVNIV